eukprot:c12498_g2_i3.p1 GENE.c12498_g2_i3~~c12498_g2_i3.p1  ORF type:complete len:507 (-),score=146.82 c12498_g2_i3:225-1745(-)
MLELKAVDAAASDEELFINYGHRSNEELITSYGFALANNPEDTAALALHIAACETQAIDWKKQKLQALGVHSLTIRIARKDLDSSDDFVALRTLLQAGRLCALDNTEAVAVMGLEKEAGKPVTSFAVVGLRNEAACVQMLVQCLVSRIQLLSNHHHSVGDHDHLLDSDVQLLLPHAKLYREGQVSILSETLSRVLKHWSLIRSLCSQTPPLPFQATTLASRNFQSGEIIFKFDSHQLLDPSTCHLSHISTTTNADNENDIESANDELKLQLHLLFHNNDNTTNNNILQLMSLSQHPELSPVCYSPNEMSSLPPPLHTGLRSLVANAHRLLHDDLHTVQESRVLEMRDAISATSSSDAVMRKCGFEEFAWSAVVVDMLTVSVPHAASSQRYQSRVPQQVMLPPSHFAGLMCHDLHNANVAPIVVLSEHSPKDGDGNSNNHNDWGYVLLVALCDIREGDPLLLLRPQRLGGCILEAGLTPQRLIHRASQLSPATTTAIHSHLAARSES